MPEFKHDKERDKSKSSDRKTQINKKRISKKSFRLKKIKEKSEKIIRLSAKKRKKILGYITKEIKADPNDFNKMVKYVTGLTFSVNVSPHILDFLQDLIKYTQLKFTDLEEILKGAYVIIRNDMGIFYKLRGFL